MFDRPLHLTKPGLFVTATDTGVGKTTVACAIAWNLRRQGVSRVGVCKPLASGCRRDREGLVSEDAEALAHFADCRQPLDVICPVRYAPPVAPAVAAELTKTPPDWAALERSLRLLDDSSDVVLVEGIGGLLVPLGERGKGKPGSPYVTVLDLATALNYPVVVVTRATLGTLSHTAMTVRLLREAGCRVAGIVINGYVADAGTMTKEADLTMSTNRLWLERMNKAPILAVVPACPASDVAPQRGVIAETILDAVGATYWMDVAESNL